MPLTSHRGQQRRQEFRCGKRADAERHVAKPRLRKTRRRVPAPAVDHQHRARATTNSPAGVGATPFVARWNNRSRSSASTTWTLRVKAG